MGPAVERRTAEPELGQVPRRHRVRRLRHPGPDLVLRRHLQPDLGPAVKRRFLALLAAVALALGLGTAVAYQAQAATTAKTTTATAKVATSKIATTKAAATPAATVGATGAITGYEGLCLDDRARSTTAGNPAQLYTCN